MTIAEQMLLGFLIGASFMWSFAFWMLYSKINALVKEIEDRPDYFCGEYNHPPPDGELK